MNYTKYDNAMLIQGDCIEIMQKLIAKGVKVDMVLCDLPYHTTACSWDKYIPQEQLWDCYNKLLKPQGSVLLFACGLFTPRVMLSNIDDYKYRWIWVKNNSTNFVHAKNRPMTKSEDILVFSKAPMGHISQLGDKRMIYNPQGLIPCGKVKKAGSGKFGTVAGKRPSHKEEVVQEFTNYPTDVLVDFPEDCANKKFHTSQKPIALLEYLIKTYTNENMIVLDNTMGSGSTGVACVNTNRRFIGIELEEKYFEISKTRIKEAIDKKSEEK